MKAQTWTRYEIFLFTNCMYAFHPKFIDLILEKSFLSLAVYEENRSGQSETFRMLANGLILFIKNQDLRLVWKYGAKLEEYFLEEELYYERNLQLFLQGVWYVIKGNKKGKYHIKNALAVSCYLDSKQQYQKNTNCYASWSRRTMWILNSRMSFPPLVIECYLKITNLIRKELCVYDEDQPYSAYFILTS
ncbi:hypothetical protein SNF32_12930 [Enterococcus mundtii]|nr:hypothetical protein [Enterococcus mundtii]